MADEKAAEETVAADMGMNGNWEVESVDNLEKFLKEVGENWVKRKLASARDATVFKSKYKVMIKQDGNNFTIEAGSSGNLEKLSVKLGETFEHKIPPNETDGKGKLTVSADGKSLETTFEESTLKTVRTLEGDMLVEKKTFKEQTVTIKMKKKADDEAKAAAA